MTAAEERRVPDYLEDILEAIRRCLEYVDDMDEAAFMQDRKTQDAVIRTFEVMGEASGNIKRRYPDFAERHPELPVGTAIGMRNVLAHGYFKVDLPTVWKTIHSDLPGLQRTVQTLVDTFER